MTFFQNLLTPDVTRAAALAILHFLWQGAALAAMASAAMAICRNAGTRYAIGVAALAVMVAAPVVTFVTLRQQTPARNAPEQISLSPLPGLAPVAANSIVTSQTRVPRPATSDSLPWLVEAWLVGVFLLSLRPAVGFVVLQKLRRGKEHPVADKLLQRCLVLQQRLGLSRIVRYCECAYLEAPAAVGWICPVILLPVSAITGLSLAQLDAVIAHELAHVKRFDAFVNLFQIAAETLLFYHPAVWWLSKRIRAERENCCDDVAVAICGNAADYARALASMSEWQAAPVMAMASNRHPVSARVARILGISKWQSGIRGGSLAASILCLSVSLFAGHALLDVGRANATPQTPQVSSARLSPMTVSIATLAPAAAMSEPVIQVTAPRISAASAQASGSTYAMVTSAIVIEDQETSTSSAASKPEKTSSYIDELKSAGLDNLSIDELVALKIQGVTADYVRSIRALGWQPKVDEIIAMKIQGITPEYVKSLGDMGFKVDAEIAIAMKVQGITPEYVKEIRDMGLKADAEEAIAMKVQGITPEYVKSLRDLGLKADAEEAVGMKVQGVTPEYIKGLRDLGLKADTEEIIGMKVQGVTPEYVREMQALGLKLDGDDIVGMKIQGVTAEYVKSLQAAGLRFDTEELIGAKVQGITPEFLQRVRQHGFKDLDLGKLIQLKNSGVLD